MAPPRAALIRDARWLIPAAVAVLAGALWVRNWGIVELIIATAALVTFAFLGRDPARRFAWVAFLLAMGFFVISAWIAVAQLERFEEQPARYQQQLDSLAIATLDRVMSSSRARLAASARTLLGISPLDPARFERSQSALPVAANGEVSGVVRDSAGAYAWAGTVRIDPDVIPDAPSGIVSNEFYTVAFAQERAGGGGQRTAITMLTLHAAPPGDRLARDVSSVVARRVGITRFDIHPQRREGSLPLLSAGDTVGFVSANLPPAGALRLRIEGRGRGRGTVALALAVILGLGVAWRRPASPLQRGVALAAAVVTIAILPLNTLSNASVLFDPSYYFTSLGGPFTASVGALAATSSVVLISLFTLLRNPLWIRSRVIAAFVALSCVSLGPYLMRDLARGITMPPRGVGMSLWIAWDLGLFLPGAALLFLAMAAGQVARITVRWLSPVVGSLFGLAAAAMAPVVWRAPGSFPQWYVVLWILAMAGVVLSRRTRTSLVHAALVAACGAGTLVWANVTRGRVQLAEQDVAGLAVADDETRRLLERLLDRARPGPIPSTRASLLRLYVGSEIAAAGNPIELALWRTNAQRPTAELVIADLRRREEGESGLVAEADSLGVPVIREFGSSQGIQLVLAAPLDSTRVLTAVAAPRSRLIAEDPFSALLGLDVPGVVEPPYRLAVAAATPASGLPVSRLDRWERRGDELLGDWQLEAVLGNLHAHVEVELRSLEALAPRGALLILLNLAVIGLLWISAATSDGALRRWIRGRTAQWRNSYRARLTITFFAAFVVPSVAFALWTYRRLQDEDLLSRSLLVQETLRAVGPAETQAALEAEGERMATPLFVYRGGKLSATSDELYRQLAPLGLFLDPGAGSEVSPGNETSATRRASVAGTSTLFGYRVRGDGSILGAPARRSELELERQQRDLIALLSFALAIGALIALWLSGIAARAFARPIRELRSAAQEVADGARTLTTLGPRPPSEFEPVFGAFRTMAVDLADSREELARAQRVLAWGEMARQVAHEIKNPLTPIRLGVQHLMRARADDRADFDQILERNVDRILGEIDRLDEISRSFARFGTRSGEAQPGVPTEVSAIARDVVELERLGESGVNWSLPDDAEVWALSRDTELREVLLNLLENARHAEARNVDIRIRRLAGKVQICVEDDGHGIAPDVQQHLFEPRFSTRTSGSGLGLAISRQMVESWGGSIRLYPRDAGRSGTVAEITLVAAEQA